jgi:inorganic triphosphatase YgiF
MGHEVELKLEAAPHRLERLMRQPWLESEDCRSAQQISSYYDTPGNELRKRGYSLRIRSTGETYVQTVKSLDTGAGFFERGEWEYQVRGPEIDPQKLGHTPLGRLDTILLKPVIRCEVTRTACRLRLDGAEIELDIDQGSISAGGIDEPISEIEIELVSGEPAAVVDLARRISAEVPVKLGVLTEAERGFALADGKLGKVIKAEPVRIEPGMTVADGFATIVAACIRHFRLNEASVVQRRFPDALHQTRVAMRRLRAAISLFRTAIADDELARLRSELRWFTRELGDARNLDVYLQRELPDEQRRDLTRERGRAYDRVIDAMESHRFRILVLDLVAWTSLGTWREHTNAGMPLEPYVSRRIDRLWHKIHAVNHVSRMDEEERHQLRILIKKLRYALEFVQALHGHEAARQKKFARSVEDLQQTLGLLNDAAVGRALVAADAWTIDFEDEEEEERKLVRQAEHALKRLREIGPYWH